MLAPVCIGRGLAIALAVIGLACRGSGASATETSLSRRVAEPLAVCAAHPLRVGMCVLKINPNDNFSNDDPARAGRILAIGEARPECFAGTNWSHAIPIVWEKAPPPNLPERTLWLRLDDPQHGQLVIGVAAPGIEQLGIAVGDRASIDWPISVGGEWGWGTASLRVEGRGRVQFALNDLPAHGLSFGRATCARNDACPGDEHVLHMRQPDVAAAVGQSARRGGVTLTNAEAIARSPAFIETHEGYTGPSGCQGQKRASLAAIVTQD